MYLASAIATIVSLLPGARSLQLRGFEPNDSKNLREGSTSPTVFEPAKDIDFFANVDPDQFEWVNPEEIRPGETTCGFLKAPLGWEVDRVDVVYPEVKVCKCRA